MVAVPGSLAQYAGDASSLFNNMRTTASIVGGALVPMAVMSPLPTHVDEEKGDIFKNVLRRLYSFVGTCSLVSILLTVVWCTVTANKLTEMPIAPAESVW